VSHLNQSANKTALMDKFAGKLPKKGLSLARKSYIKKLPSRWSLPFCQYLFPAEHRTQKWLWNQNNTNTDANAKQIEIKAKNKK
jgi:hypothetical protein